LEMFFNNWVSVFPPNFCLSFKGAPVRDFLLFRFS
jgi:hypothetical protein